MGDSEFSSVHWDSPPPSSFPDHSEQNHVNNNLLSTSPATQSVAPEMDPLQAPPSNEHILICVRRPGRLRGNGRMCRLLRKRRMVQKMPMYRILLQLRYTSSCIMLM
jgi:hypothetical protein